MSKRLTPDDWPGGRGAWVRFGLMLMVLFGLIAVAVVLFVGNLLWMAGIRIDRGALFIVATLAGIGTSIMFVLRN